jgi:hypothetical protein
LDFSTSLMEVMPGTVVTTTAGSSLCR